jgi:uncharacterized coiled-coil DUF342 family protein
MKEKYTPGEGCECHAHSESECGCDVDWTPREVYELRETISDLETRHAATMLHTQSIVDEANELREQRDRLLEEREQWRMSSVCRELREQRDRLATEVTEARAETTRTREFMDHGFKVAKEEITELREQRDMLEEAATVLIAAKGRHNTMLAYQGLREALEAVEGGRHDH